MKFVNDLIYFFWIVGKVMMYFFMFFKAKMHHDFPDDPRDRFKSEKVSVYASCPSFFVHFL